MTRDALFAAGDELAAANELATRAALRTKTLTAPKRPLRGLVFIRLPPPSGRGPGTAGTRLFICAIGGIAAAPRSHNARRGSFQVAQEGCFSTCPGEQVRTLRVGSRAPSSPRRQRLAPGS